MLEKLNPREAMIPLRCVRAKDLNYEYQANMKFYDTDEMMERDFFNCHKVN